MSPEAWSQAVGEIVEYEVDRFARLIPHDGGSVERGDLISAGWLGALENRAAAEEADSNLAFLRVRIRRYVADALRREWRQLGRVPRTVMWPVYWPRTPGRVKADRYSYERRRRRRCVDCPAEVPNPWSKRCPDCAKRRRLAKQRGYNMARWRRLHSIEAVA